jgi:hypothetical protein
MILDRITGPPREMEPLCDYTHPTIFPELMDKPGRIDILILKATARLDRHVTCRLQTLLMN